MKMFTVCQVADLLSESLLTLFLSPNDRYSHSYFVKYAESNLKGADPDDIVLIEYDGCLVFDSFSDFYDHFTSGDPDVATFSRLSVIQESLKEAESNEG